MGCGCGVGDEVPAVVVPLRPTRQQGASQPRLGGRGERHASALPPAAHLGSEPPNRPVMDPALGQEPIPVRNPHHRMPAQVHDRLEQPPRVQPAIGQDHHGPIRVHLAVEPLQQRLPFGPPGMLHVAAEDLPGHGDGRPAVDDTDREHDQAVEQAGRVQGHGQAGTGPILEDPLGLRLFPTLRRGGRGGDRRSTSPNVFSRSLHIDLTTASSFSMKWFRTHSSLSTSLLQPPEAPAICLVVRQGNGAIKALGCAASTPPTPPLQGGESSSPRRAETPRSASIAAPSSFPHPLQIVSQQTELLLHHARVGTISSSASSFTPRMRRSRSVRSSTASRSPL